MDIVDVQNSETFFSYCCRGFEEGAVSKTQQTLRLQSFADPPRKLQQSATVL